ncbi:neutral zinc metallopeptidase [Nocardia sp. CA-084685]|uniref:neutral zinc metallopeptidase n=1 Tax=Nocardia sp. CA-084685 TaxID=3239970 RepID=UPI003D98EB78
MLAHEWGHAIQTRANFQGLTVTQEIQADCFAGAWAADVAAGHSSFKAETNDLDAALAGFLTLRDEPGTDKTNPAAHGSGFDRVSSFQTGFDGGPESARDRADPRRDATSPRVQRVTDLDRTPHRRPPLGHRSR